MLVLQVDPVLGGERLCVAYVRVGGVESEGVGAQAVGKPANGLPRVGIRQPHAVQQTLDDAHGVWEARPLVARCNDTAARSENSAREHRVPPIVHPLCLSNPLFLRSYTFFKAPLPSSRLGRVGRLFFGTPLVSKS